MIDIVYTKWGLANRFTDPDCIELNQSLKTNQRLHDAILDHELKHKNSNTFKQDLANDLTPINKLSQKDLLLFMLKHPTTFTQLLPFYWSPKRKEVIYDSNLIIIYFFMLIIIGLIVYLI